MNEESVYEVLRKLVNKDISRHADAGRSYSIELQVAMNFLISMGCIYHDKYLVWENKDAEGRTQREG